MRSMKTMPGSPLSHAMSTIRENTSRARSFETTAPVRGLTRSYSESLFTALMKSSVSATEQLKLVSCVLSFFA